MDIIGILPPKIAQEINKMYASGRSALSEIRLRLCGRSTLVMGGERIYLFSTLSKREMEETVDALCDGALYAHRDSIMEGYLSLAGGVRVGLCGQARYDGGRLVGVSNISSLVFRIPSGESEVADELFSAFDESKRGMLIYSPPGIGKTTALRTLVRSISRGRRPLQVAVVDERGEFPLCDYEGCTVDVLRGYRRDKGIEIALRSLSVEVIVIDEIGGSGEVLSMLDFANSGVRMLATAHSDSYENLIMRKSLKGFFEAEVFDLFAGLSLVGGRRVVNLKKR